MEHPDTRCIECGGVVGSLNEDENGTPCAVCAERLLETLPGIFHAPWGSASKGAEETAPEAALAERLESEEA